MMNTPIYWLVDETTQRKLRALAPAGWQPPHDEFKPYTLKVKLEDIEELARIMKWRPRHIKRDRVKV